MARYYFNVINGDGVANDEEGDELPDLDAARDHAIVGIRSILSEELRLRGLIDLKGRIEVAGMEGTVSLVVPYREAVKVIPDDDLAAAEDG